MHRPGYGELGDPFAVKHRKIRKEGFGDILLVKGSRTPAALHLDRNGFGVCNSLHILDRHISRIKLVVSIHASAREATGGGVVVCPSA